MYRNIFLKKFLALHKVRKNKNIIQKSDKGRSVMIIDKADLDKMENLLNDTQKFEKLNLKNDGILNFAINQENVLTTF